MIDWLLCFFAYAAVYTQNKAHKLSKYTFLAKNKILYIDAVKFQIKIAQTIYRESKESNNPKVAPNCALWLHYTCKQSGGARGGAGGIISSADPV